MKLDTLDKWFSRYIRLRDSQNGVIKCCSCGKIVPILQSDCGHFVNRKHLSLRFNEINTNAQCRSCNRFDEGNLPEYALFLQNKYGKNIIEKLIVAKHQTVKYSTKDVQEMTNFYKGKVKELEIEKGFKF